MQKIKKRESKLKLKTKNFNLQSYFRKAILQLKETKSIQKCVNKLIQLILVVQS